MRAESKCLRADENSGKLRELKTISYRKITQVLAVTEIGI